MEEILLEINRIIDDFLGSPPLEGFLFWFKPLIAVFCLILVINIVFLARKVDYFWFVKYRLDAFGDEKFIKRAEKKWQEIEKKLNMTDSANLKLAVIEADNFMDEILKRMNLGGENMGERLQRLDISKLESLNLVWEAHKIRNRIVHDSSYNLRSDEAKKAVENYGKALKELQVL